MPSTEEARYSHGASQEPQDPVESIVGAMPLVLPLMAAILMFLLAFIAVYLA